ncbi:toxin-antitoxin system TumE family protein [Hydrogenimonas sp.]
MGKDGEVVKYSMAYINPRIFPNDHGRVVGYDNAHNFHHKHYLGEIFEIDDFTSYKELTERFRKDLQEFIDDGN